jgi:hypothetical protein
MFVPGDFYSFGPYTKLWKVDDVGWIQFRHTPIVRNRLRRMPDTTAQIPEMWTLLGEGSNQLTAMAPIVITRAGTPGSTVYGYQVAAYLADGSSHNIASAEAFILTGNAVLSSSNYTIVTWELVPGAASYKVWRTTGGASVRLIAVGQTGTFYNDVGTQIDTSTPPTTDTTRGYSKKILFAPAAQGAINFELTDYRAKPPVLVDEAISTVLADGDTLLQLPEQYHEPVLLDYLRRRLMGDEGDEREPMADQDFRLALRDAWAEENPENLEAGALPPSFFGSGSEDSGGGY